MSYEKLEMLINGQMRAGSDGAAEDVINPATEEVLGQVPHASTADLNEALDAAEAGFKIWKNMPALNRQKIINKAADILEADYAERSGKLKQSWQLTREALAA